MRRGERRTVELVVPVLRYAPPVDPALERALRERMAPSVRRFAALTGLDLGAWGYPG